MSFLFLLFPEINVLITLILITITVSLAGTLFLYVISCS